MEIRVLKSTIWILPGKSDCGADAGIYLKSNHFNGAIDSIWKDLN